MTAGNYELIIAGAVVALVGKIVFDWLKTTSKVTNDHNLTQENYKMLGQVETELRKQNHALANIRQLLENLTHNILELRKHEDRDYKFKR